MLHKSSMLDRSALSEAMQVARFVPEAYAPYRPLVMEWLLFFL